MPHLCFDRLTTLGLILALVLVSACGVRQRLGFGPAVPAVALPFDARLTKVEEDPRAFFIRVEANGNGLSATRESVRFPATAYCLQTFGDTDIEWRRDASGDWAGAPQEGGDIVYAGRCSGR